MADKKYRGCVEIPRLIQEYVDLRRTDQLRVAQAVGRGQSGVSMLMGGWWKRNKNDEEVLPYFGMKHQGGEELLLLVAKHLRIPMSKVTRAYQEDMLAWSVEKARRAMAVSRKSASR